MSQKVKSGSIKPEELIKHIAGKTFVASKFKLFAPEIVKTDNNGDLDFDADA